MTALIQRLSIAHARALSVAVLATVVSAGLAFADQGLGPAPAAEPGLANAALHAGKVVPVRNGDETTDETEDVEEVEEEVEEDVEEEVEEVEEDGENCATDPTTLTEEELAEMRHGSIVCWAAHQDTPEGYDNHGAWVSEWAKSNGGPGDDEASDDEADEADEDDEAGAAARGNGKDKGKGQGRGRP